MSVTGELKFFLGLQIHQQRNGIFISQEKYLKDVLRKLKMHECKGVKTPMPTNGHLSTDENGKDFDQQVYRSTIGSLLYLCAFRPDVMLSVCMCACFQAKPKESHHKAMKHILRYLAHTSTLGLWYPEDSNLHLVGYSDSDYAGDRVDRKSTTGTCHFLGRSLVSQSSKKQNCVSLSIAEAEYIAARSCYAQLLWMKQTLKDYGIDMKNVPLYCANESAIKIAYNPIQHSKTKHIQIRHHFLRDHVLNGNSIIDHVKIDDQLAHIFTKPLDERRFCKLRCELNILVFKCFAKTCTHPNTYAKLMTQMCNTRRINFLQSMKNITLSVKKLMTNLVLRALRQLYVAREIIILIRWVTPPPNFEILQAVFLQS